MGSRVQTNSLGWREKQFSEKKNNTIRIVGIGDSIMFGWGVEEHERYMDLLEKRLDEKYPKKNWENYVFAAPGYQLFMETEIIKKYAVNYNLDLIIYGYVSNDMCLPNFITDKKKFFSRELFTILYLKKSLDNNIFMDNADGLCEPKDVPLEYKKYVGEENFLKELKELKKINIPTIVLYHHSIPDDLKSEELYYFDGELDYHNLSLVLSKEDPHPSIKGHEKIANKLFDQMVENNITASLLEK
jgi:lysophospholipase L1-like esterase